MSRNDQETHAKFQKRLIESEPARWLVARWLSFEKKLTLHMEPILVAPTRDVAAQYADNGDIIIVEEGRKRRIEVKHIKAVFTCLADWPFKDFIVCSKYSFDKAVPRPHSYIIVNPSLTHAGIVLVANYANWVTGYRDDKGFREEQKQLYYFSPLADVEFVQIAEPTVEAALQAPKTPEWKPESTEGKLF